MELQGAKESDISGVDCTDNTRRDQLIVGFGLLVGFFSTLLFHETGMMRLFSERIETYLARDLMTMD